MLVAQNYIKQMQTKKKLTTISVQTAFSIRKNFESDIHHISLTTNKMSCLTMNIQKSFELKNVDTWIVFRNTS